MEGDKPLKCDDNLIALILLVGIAYPFVYENLHVYKIGVSNYFSKTKNVIKQLYIWGTIAMIVLHMVLNPFHIMSKVVMMAVIILSIQRTFKFMRIFSSFSPIVTMLG